MHTNATFTAMSLSNIVTFSQFMRSKQITPASWLRPGFRPCVWANRSAPSATNFKLHQNSTVAKNYRYWGMSSMIITALSYAHVWGLQLRVQHYMFSASLQETYFKFNQESVTIIATVLPKCITFPAYFWSSFMPFYPREIRNVLFYRQTSLNEKTLKRKSWNLDLHFQYKYNNSCVGW